ncbi:hypothetical protein BDW42DRAFT_163426 [Aspergillus taichungensis]|uniref:Uncharacterized protein n=1 Tax=Aspergillus taichungensis TaxID=482145 RepID=A0A2J5I2H1_9EURO|nr:hypothetical protein BDW42DRAFT_163426 [Aspergillus taichungensis]
MESHRVRLLNHGPTVFWQNLMVLFIGLVASALCKVLYKLSPSWTRKVGPMLYELTWDHLLCTNYYTVYLGLNSSQFYITLGKNIMSRGRSMQN